MLNRLGNQTTECLLLPAKILIKVADRNRLVPLRLLLAVTSELKKLFADLIGLIICFAPKKID